MMPPGKPQPRKQEETHKVKIKLPGPGQGCHVAKEYGQQVPAMLETYDARNTDDADNDHYQKISKRLHGFGPFKDGFVKIRIFRYFVIPAKAGIYRFQCVRDSGSSPE